jgi:lysophospholipase L1-like esterase
MIFRFCCYGMMVWCSGAALGEPQQVPQAPPVALAEDRSPTARPDPNRFAGEIERFAKEEPEKGGIVFTGSSSIRLWTQLKEDFAGLPVVNRGFGGCVSHDLSVFFETIIGRHEPKLIVTYSGSNDLAERLTVDEAFADYIAFLDLTHQRFPAAKVIVTSVKISPRRVLQTPQVNELNQRLSDWCKGKDWLRYLDCTRYLADAENQPIATFFRDDLLHLSESGYAEWKAILEPVVRDEWAKVAPPAP